jgi:hypothetical protein
MTNFRKIFGEGHFVFRAATILRSSIPRRKVDEVEDSLVSQLLTRRRRQQSDFRRSQRPFRPLGALHRPSNATIL